MTTLLVHFIAIIAIWSTFEGAERDLLDLLDGPTPAWPVLPCAWIVVRIVSAAALVAGVAASILGGIS